MEPRLTVVTLGVSDFERSLDFYGNRLGWPVKVVNGEVAFFKLNCVVLALYPKDLLAKDADVSPEGGGFPGFTLAHNVESPEEVDKVLDEARAAGAGIPKKAQKTSWGGYGGYFTDPDGYLWEVVHNPFWSLDEGNPVIQ
ncbi:MAG: VOC family protein [Candidatus Methylomirabilis sp.]|nr:VOC family protein [Deltaproteobacteria bacterium]